MSRDIKIRKGVNINLKGSADKVVSDSPAESTYAVKPTDFPGLIPKLLIKEGSEVKAGTAIFCDKGNEALKFVSPVSGEIEEIRRAEKRAIREVVILADRKNEYVDFGKKDVRQANREEVISKLLESGVWPMLRQRPYDIIANPSDKPKAIFISAFSSAPLGEDYDFIMHRRGEAFQSGIEVLKKLTDGIIHLNINGSIKADDAFLNARSVQINKITGPHPAGNVGVQIHHIDPLNKGEIIWTVNPQDVIAIGKVFTEGRFDASRIIAVCGSRVKSPKYFKTIQGACVKNLLSGLLEEGPSRIISGNVLTGSKINTDGYVGFYDHQVTVIPEGGEEEFMGWMMPNLGKFSLSGTFLSWLTPGKEYNLNTNMNGELRPFVISGQYEKLLPMDIYPVHLLKAILVEDIELMEKLGIYEVAPEDFALAEYECTSKIAVQQLVRKGLDLVRKETM